MDEDDDEYDYLGPEHRPELEEGSEFAEELDVEPQGMRNDINELAERQEQLLDELDYQYKAPFDEQKGLIEELKKESSVVLEKRSVSTLLIYALQKNPKAQNRCPVVAQVALVTSLVL